MILESGQTKHYQIVIGCFDTKHVEWRSKSKYWLTQSGWCSDMSTLEDSVSECSDMSTLEDSVSECSDMSILEDSVSECSDMSTLEDSVFE